MLKPCISPGCPKVTTKTRCVEHERRYQQERNALPHREAYRDRVYKAIPLGPCCVKCGHTGSPDNPLQKDHIIPVTRLQRDMYCDPNNVQTLCMLCNVRKSNH